MLYKLYKRIPGIIRKLIERFIKSIEHGEYFSETLRKIYKKSYNIGCVDMPFIGWLL